MGVICFLKNHRSRPSSFIETWWEAVKFRGSYSKIGSAVIVPLGFACQSLVPNHTRGHLYLYTKPTVHTSNNSSAGTKHCRKPINFNCAPTLRREHCQKEDREKQRSTKEWRVTCGFWTREIDSYISFNDNSDSWQFVRSNREDDGRRVNSGAAAARAKRESGRFGERSDDPDRVGRLAGEPHGVFSSLPLQTPANHPQHVRRHVGNLRRAHGGFSDAHGRRFPHHGTMAF